MNRMKETFLGKVLCELMFRRTGKEVDSGNKEKLITLVMMAFIIVCKIIILRFVHVVSLMIGVFLDGMDIGPTAMTCLNHLGICCSPDYLARKIEKESKYPFRIAKVEPKRKKGEARRNVVTVMADNIQKVFKTSRQNRDEVYLKGKKEHTYTNVAWFYNDIYNDAKGSNYRLYEYEFKGK